MIKTSWVALPLFITLVILPRLSTDLYLPSLPHMASSFNTSEQLLQMTLTVFMFGYSISMLVAGQLCDTIGRKKVIIYGVSLYFIATLICSWTHSINVLIIARFFQALGGCCGTVVARVMVRDAYPKEDQIKILSHLSAAMAICPLLAPILGGTLVLYAGWRSIFYLLSIFALFILILSANQLHEHHFQPKKMSFMTLITNYKKLLCHRLFIGYSLAIGLAWSAYFAFTLESPFILQQKLHLNSISFGVIFSLVVVGYLFGTQLTKKIANKIGWNELIFVATFLCLIGSLLMMALILTTSLCWEILAFPMLIVMCGVGIIIPCTQAAVMQPFADIAGTASGLFFFIQMSFGTVTGLILSLFSKNSAFPMVITILIASILLIVSFYYCIWTTKKEDR